MRKPIATMMLLTLLFSAMVPVVHFISPSTVSAYSLPDAVPVMLHASSEDGGTASPPRSTHPSFDADVEQVNLSEETSLAGVLGVTGNDVESCYDDATSRALGGLPTIGYGMAVASVDDQALALVEGAGFGWVLHYVSWALTEPSPGQYDWAWLDDAVAKCESRDLNIVMRIDRPPAWANGGGEETAPPTDPQYLRDFMHALVTRFGSRVSGYVIWNEPNLAAEWGGETPDAERYVNLLWAAYEGAKAADPSVTIVSAGLASTNDVSSRAVDDRVYLQRMYDAGAASAFDVMGSNPLGFASSPDDTSDPNHFYFSRVTELRDIMVSNGDASKSVWALELGWLYDTDVNLGDFNWMKVSPEQQADYLVRAYCKARQEWPWMEVMFVWNLDFSLHELASSHKYWYSIVDDDRTPRPAYLALRDMILSPLVADFSASPVSGFAPLTVHFSNLSRGNCDTCVWDFGDGDAETTCGDPTHTYRSAGTYSVSLTVSGTGCTDVKTREAFISVEGATIYLPLLRRAPTLVSSVLTPFDANSNDLSGPSSWTCNYGKKPEIIVSSTGDELDVLAQDYDPGTVWDAVLLHIEPNSTGYGVTQALTDMPMLDRVMGLATDDAGNRYYATGVDESDVVDPYYPPADTYRSNIVRVVKLNPAGDVLFNIDLDKARHAHDSDAEMIINPMVASTSRLAVGGNEVALVHGINTGPDWNINGARHQKALSTRLNATSGAIMRTSSVWVSHSFDQRLVYDGEGIIEHHLGDAYPRYIVFARHHTSYPLFHIKGELGQNNTFTRLGNLALIEGDPNYGYVALFATESNAETGDGINGPRNLAMVRVNSSDNSVDPSLPDTLTVNSSGTRQTNRLRWLTHYSNSSGLHVERPKLIGVGGDQYIALWEQWQETGGYSESFNGVFGMVIDDRGNTLRGPRLITDQHHLHRGDDAFLLDNRAAWMTGSAVEQKLYIHFVNTSLSYERVTLH